MEEGNKKRKRCTEDECQEQKRQRIDMKKEYTEEKKEEENNEQICTICLCRLSNSLIAVLHCGHAFHFDCQFSWYMRSQTCPTCRQETVHTPFWPCSYCAKHIAIQAFSETKEMIDCLIQLYDPAMLFQFCYDTTFDWRPCAEYNETELVV